MQEITARQIADLVGGTVHGDDSHVVRRVAPLDRADSESLTFVASARYLSYLGATRAGVVLSTGDWLDSVPEGTTAVVVPDPHRALKAVLTAIFPTPHPEPGVHASALVAATASVHPDASVGPFAVIEDDVEIGSGSVIGSHCVIGRGCRIAERVTIHPHVTLYEGVMIGSGAIIHSGARIGRPGFGYVWEDGGHRKIPQVGGCRIEADAEIGTNVTIDRGSIGDTVVGEGTKIDNLVHLGHNVRLGKHVLLVAQVGISGSTTVGDGAVLAGQVGVGGHLTIGPKATIGGQGGVTGDVPAGATYSGYPARPHRDALRAQASVFRLPRLIERLKRLEEAVFGKREVDNPLDTP